WLSGRLSGRLSGPGPGSWGPSALVAADAAGSDPAPVAAACWESVKLMQQIVFHPIICRMTHGKRIRVSLALAAAMAGAGVLWAEGVWPHVAPKNFGVVHVEGGAEGGEGRRQVYRSGELTVAATAKVVERYGIRTIVDLGTHEPGTPEERIAQKTAEALGLTRYRFDLEGDAT